MLINCDLGECLIPNPDAVIMPLINMANIACGGHAGDDKSMVQTIQLALKNKVTIGAHPSYADKENFGRISHNLNNNVLFELIYRQVSSLKKHCADNAAKLTYIKPHGALYHDMVNKPAVLQTMVKVIQAVDKNLHLVVPTGFKVQTWVNLQSELFADRAYNNGKILPRSESGAVLTQVDTIIKQYHQFLSKQNCHSICFHSDNSASVEALQQLKYST